MDRPHIALKTLEANVTVDGIYNLVNPQIGVTRQNQPYLKCLLRDATGEVAARKWRFAESDLPVIARTGFVWISGRSELYNDQPQLILDEIRATEVDERDLAMLLPTTSRDIQQMFDRLREILGTLEHPGMRALVDAYLGDEQLMLNFRRCPAAVSIHHAWIGGLLEHTLQLLELADRMLPLYPGLNRDIVLTGLFLHDLAKTYELSWERGFSYTLDGNLIGHVVRGAILLQFKAALAARSSGHPLPPEAIRVLQHIVLSHHTLPEHGAARVPSTPEAIFVALLDNLDARTQMSLSAVDRGNPAAGEGEFTERVWALDTRLYRPDPLADTATAASAPTPISSMSSSPATTAASSPAPPVSPTST